MPLLHTVAVTRFRGRYAVEALGASGPKDVPNGWVHVLGAGVADDVLGVTVVAGLNESDRPLAEQPVAPAAEELGADNDLALAEPGAARVVAEYDGTSILVLGLHNAGPELGFVLDEDSDTREVLADEPSDVLGLVVRQALDDATVTAP